MKRLLFIAGLLLGSATAKATDVLSINKFSGINTDENAVAIQDGQTPDSQNAVTDLGNDVQGRKGFIQFSTQPATDLWQFPLSNGTRYLIKRNGSQLLADTGSGSFSVVVSTIPSDRRTVASVLGDRFYFSNTTDGLKYWDGTSVAVASASLKVTMLATHQGRLWASGKSGEERSIRGSKLYDGTSWTAPSNPSDDDATILTVGGALDENIQAIYASYQNKLIYFKKSSFGAVIGSRRSNFSLYSYSETVGVSNQETIQDCDGFLRWLGNNRKIYEFDGANYHKISDQINNLLENIQQGDSATRSFTLETKQDWDAGTYGNSVVPAGNLSSSIMSGSIVLSTMDIVNQTDTAESDFESGTLTNLDSTSTPGSIQLSFGSASSRETTIGTNTGYSDLSFAAACGYIGQSFVATTDYFLTSVDLKISKAGSFSDATISIYTSVSSIPTTVLGTGSLSDGSDITSSPASKNIPITSVSTQNFLYLTSGQRYWILISKPSSGSSNLRWEVNGVTGSDPYRSDNGFGVCANSTNAQFQYTTYGKQYPQNGNILSRIFDVGTTTNTWLFNWGIIIADLSTPSGTGATFQTQSSDDGSNFDSLISVSNGNTIPSATRRYVRYKAFLTTSNPLSTPVASQIEMLTGSFLKSSGTYTSQLVNVGNNVSLWGPLTIGNSVSSGGSETFQIGSTNTASISAITNWTSISNNQVPTISTNPYVAIRSTFTATRATDTVQLNSLSLSWTDGSTIRPASGWIDQRYWLAVATNSATNNMVLVYDRNHQFEKYVGINADCMGQYNSNLYFSNSLGIFEAEQGYSDAGSNILGFFTTKDYAPTNPDVVSSFKSLYMTTDKSDATLATSYSINASTTLISMGSVQMNSDGAIQNFKIPFSLSDVNIGKFLHFVWQVTGATFWRIINGDVYFDKGTQPE